MFFFAHSDRLHFTELEAFPFQCTWTAVSRLPFELVYFWGAFLNRCTFEASLRMGLFFSSYRTTCNPNWSLTHCSLPIWMQSTSAQNKLNIVAAFPINKVHCRCILRITSTYSSCKSKLLLFELLVRWFYLHSLEHAWTPLQVNVSLGHLLRLIS